jgi:hypothetical protein
MDQVVSQPFVGVGIGAEDCDLCRSSRPSCGSGAMGMARWVLGSRMLVQAVGLAMQCAPARGAAGAERVSWEWRRGCDRWVAGSGITV